MTEKLITTSLGGNINDSEKADVVRLTEHPSTYEGPTICSALFVF